MYDLAHGLWNMVKNVLDLVTASGKMHLKPARRAEEVGRGRFITVPHKPPWVASEASQDTVCNALLALKVPTDWPANPDISNGGASMKIAEGLAVCGDRGQWIIGQLYIDVAYSNVLVDMLGSAGACLKKYMPKDELKELCTADLLTLSPRQKPSSPCSGARSPPTCCFTRQIGYVSTRFLVHFVIFSGRCSNMERSGRSTCSLLSACTCSSRKWVVATKTACRAS